jgi:LmbE family N-acetylglucosaminyl deacetylase
MTGNNTIQLYEFALPLLVSELGRTVVVAPHPDDESLGCGGTIALVRQAGLQVYVIFISDGSMSHPASKKYPADKRVELRESEAINALKILGVDKDCIHFMQLKDSAVPANGSAGFNEATTNFNQHLMASQPTTILVPWRRDPHKDHRATWQIVQVALVNYHLPVRLFEYFIWLWERSQSEDIPQKNEAMIWQVDTEAVAPLKQMAIMAHVSQVTNLIDDDPQGFILSPNVLAHFSGNSELFAEVNSKQ